MTRFRIGDPVVVKTEPIWSRYAGHEGVVVDVKPGRPKNPSDRTLDKYTVRFPDADQHEFYDVQLTASGRGPSAIQE